MAERGIIFSAPMVRALLDGRKTQTRRLVRPELVGGAKFMGPDRDGLWLFVKGYCYRKIKPAYNPGDRLYVREHWSSHIAFDGIPPRDLKQGSMIYTRADDTWHNAGDVIGAPYGKHRQGMHMPRWASRLTLIVTDVRVQRLQEIGPLDAMAEGIWRYNAEGQTFWNFRDPNEVEEGDGYRTPVSAYRELWNSLHPEVCTRWEDDPWICAVTFDVIRQNIDRIAA